ncbi:hypothetical protein PR001_g487 [Phytophthora rubi]|uniref:Uncharacterized protein n=1 Tax=Phytophthora rubi TaxID=129364 RepID=A0A6A3P2Y5_9STRA|nr:hypothetical protein PR001_g487 [Phytophthora rubi]
MGDASRAPGISLEHASFRHLPSTEWDALHRLVAVSGDGVIKTLPTAGTEVQRRLAAQELMVRELGDLRERVSTPTQSDKNHKTDIVKIDVSTYTGEGAARLHLNRWFYEVDIAVEARQLSTELARTRFVPSKCVWGGGEWALGKLVTRRHMFHNYYVHGV